MLRESLQLERVESVLATAHVLHRVLTPATLTGRMGIMTGSGIKQQCKRTNIKKQQQQGAMFGCHEQRKIKTIKKRRHMTA